MIGNHFKSRQITMKSTQLKTHIHQKWTKIQLLTTDALIMVMSDSWSWYFIKLITDMRHHDFKTHLSRSGSFDKCQLQTQSASSSRFDLLITDVQYHYICGGWWLVSLTIRLDSCLSVWFFWGGLMLDHNTFCKGHFSSVRTCQSHNCRIWVNSIHNWLKPEMKSLFWFGELLQVRDKITFVLVFLRHEMK